MRRRPVPGLGCAICVVDAFIVVGECGALAVYDAHSLRKVGRFHKYSNGIIGVCGSHNGRVAAVFATNDAPQHEVVEYALPSGDRLRGLGQGVLVDPIGVDANHVHVAVSEWSAVCSRVTVFAAKFTEAPPLWRFGDVHGAGPTKLNFPVGVKLARDGAAVYVADTGNRRVVRLSVVGAGVLLDVVVPFAPDPTGVLEIDGDGDGDGGGLVVVNYNQRSLQVHGPSCDDILLSKCDMGYVVGAAYDAKVGLVVTNTDHLVVFNYNFQWDARPLRQAWVRAATTPCKASADSLL